MEWGDSVSNATTVKTKEPFSGFDPRSRIYPRAERFCQAPSLMAAPRRSCSSFVGEVK